MVRHALSRGVRPSESTRRPTLFLAIAVATTAVSLYAPSSTRAADGTWTGTAAGAFNYSDTTQWFNGTVADGSGAVANFATVDPAGDVTVTVDADHTLGSLSFSDTDPANTPASWTLDGGSTLTLAGPSAPTITVGDLGAGKAVTISAPVTAAAGFTKAGNGTLVINNAANALTAPVTIAAGTLNGGDSGAGLGSATITLMGTATLGAPTNRNNTWTMANPLAVDASATGATFNSSNRMRMNGAVTGSGTLNFNVTTTVTRLDLQNDWTGFSGNLNFVGSGGIRLGINALGSGQPRFNAAGWASTNMDLGGSVVLNPNTNSGGNTIQIGALSGSSPTAQLGIHSAGGAATWSVGGLGTNTVFAGGIRGSENFTKVGTGTLVLTSTDGTIDTTGTFSVDGGILQIDGNKAGSGATNVNAGGTLAGNGTIAGLVTVNAGGHVAPGTASSVGTLTLTGGLTLNPGALIDTEFNASSNDSLISTSTLTINGGSVNLLNEGTANPFSTNGTYNLIQYSSLAGLGVGGLGVNNPQSGKIYTFGTSGNFITLAISSGGAPVYWNKSAGGAWSADGNWTAAAPNATGAFAGFGGGGTPITADATVTLDGDKTVGTLSLNNPSFRYTIAQGTGGSLILDNGSTDAAITDAAGSHTVSAPVTLSTVGNELNVVSAADSLTLSGALSGPGSVNKVGAGTVVLAAANPNFTGTYTPSAGTTQVTNADAFQSATLNGGSGSIATALPSLNVGHLGNGTINFASATQLLTSADGATSTFSGSLTGPVTLVKQAAAGYLYLAGNNAHTGGVIVNGGFLSLLAPQSYTGGTVLKNGASLELFPTATLDGDVTVSDNSTIYLLPTGSSGSPSIFPHFNVVLPASATAYVNSSGLGNGLGGSVVGDASTTLVVQNQTSFSALATAANAHQFADMLGTVRVDGTLRFSATTLDNGGDNTTFQVDGLLATRNGGAVSLGALTGTGTLSQGLSSDGASTYTVGLKGTSTTFAGSITDAANRQTNLVKAGTGTLTLNGSDNRANGSTTTVNGGTLQLGHDNAISSNSPVTVNTGGTLDIHSFNQTSPSLDGTGGTVLLPAATLSLNGSADTAFAGSVAGGGTLSKDGSATQTIGAVDLATVTVNAGRLALNSPAAASRIQTLNVSAAPLQLDTRLVLPNMTQADARTLVLAGRNGGAWDGFTGITTTPDLHHGIAITTVSTLGTAAFPGLTGLTGSETLLVGTLYGDLNLDGVLNADDYALLDRGFARGLTGWTNGDLNYDGVIDQGDYFLIDSTYGQTQTLSPGFLAERESEFGPAYVSQLIASVPEPCTLAGLLVTIPFLARRRRGHASR